MPPPSGCPLGGHPYPEVTGVFCRVPSTSFSQAPWYALPVHLCRFGVRSIVGAISWNIYAALNNPISQNNHQRSSLPNRPRNINLVPIAYGFRPRLRGRLTLRGLALRRNPWASARVFLTLFIATHVSILTSDISRHPHGYPSQTYRTLRYRAHISVHPQLRWMTLAPLHLRRRTAIRPVSCYAFFQGWLLLSQPPGCLGLPTSFPT